MAHLHDAAPTRLDHATILETAKATEPQAELQDAAVSSSDIVLNELADAAPPRRRSRPPVLMSRPNAAPPFWLEVADPAPPPPRRRSTILASQPFEPPPFAFPEVRRRRVRSRISIWLRIAAPAVISLTSVAAVVLVALWAMNRPAVARAPQSEPAAIAVSRAELPPVAVPPVEAPLLQAKAPEPAAEVRRPDAAPVVAAKPPVEEAALGDVVPAKVELQPAVAVAVVQAAAERCDVCDPKAAPVCADCQNQGPDPAGSYGTRVVFTDNPANAAREAKEQNKLLFVMTISGNFEESRFT